VTTSSKPYHPSENYQPQRPFFHATIPQPFFDKTHTECRQELRGSGSSVASRNIEMEFAVGALQYII
jgi:hypothetical protein